MKSHAKQIENIPPEMRIAQLPPSDAEAEETKTYIREKLGLPISETPVSKIFLANEIIERSCILEGRIGEWEGLVAFVLLYRFSKQLKTIYVVPVDGVDAREIAKAILWGYLSDLPHRFASSDIVSSDRFFQMKTFDLARLGNMQVLEQYKESYRKSLVAEFLREQSARHQAERLSKESEEKAVQLQEDLDLTQGKLEAAHESAFRWNIAAMILAVLIPITAIATHYFRL